MGPIDTFGPMGMNQYMGPMLSSLGFALRYDSRTTIVTAVHWLSV